MKIYGMETNEVIINEIGSRVKAKRIAQSITQKELAFESGVSLRTISGFENGENISISNLISLLRVLRSLQDIDLLLPEKKISPIEVLNLGHNRQRVSRPKKKVKTSIQWGEDE